MITRRQTQEVGSYVATGSVVRRRLSEALVEAAVLVERKVCAGQVGPEVPRLDGELDGEGDCDGKVI